MRDRLAAVLPKHLPVDRFVRAALIAIAKPEMHKITTTARGRASIYEAILKAAGAGLLLDGREAALAPFSNKESDGWVDVAQYMPMVAGILKLARNSGEISAIYCNAVYSNDLFRLSFVAEGCPIVHEPALDERGEFLGVYALARLKTDDWTQAEWMNREQVDQVRERSRSGATKDRDGKARRPSGPWVTDYVEMARKTVLRRAAKLWPSSSDRDGLALALEEADRDTDLEMIETAAPQRTRLEAPARKQRGAAVRALAAPPAVEEPKVEADASETADV
jgi:recombination protein RecT